LILTNKINFNFAHFKYFSNAAPLILRLKIFTFASFFKLTEKNRK